MILMPTVSVIIPVYNAERFLVQAVESILRQTYQDFELIVVDDGSPDQSMAMIAQLGSAKIRCLRTPQQGGPSGARNWGIRHARGQFIAFLDADDVALPLRLEKQVAFLIQHPNVGLLGTWAEIIGEQGQLAADQWAFSPEPSAHLPVNLLFHNRFIGSSVMLRAELATAQGFDPTLHLAEDYDLWVRLAQLTACAILPEKLVQYRIHPHSLSYGKTSQMRQSTRLIVRNQLAALGVAATEAALTDHINIGKLQLADNLAAWQATANWLQQLAVANQTAKVYEPAALSGAFGHLWFHAATFYCRYGWPACQILLRSPITHWLPVNQQFKLLALGIKYSLTNLKIHWGGKPKDSTN